MSDYDDDDLDTGDLPAQLRKQLKEKDKNLKQLSEQLETLARKDRQRTLADTFKSRSVNEKVAGFYPSDREATEEAINSWLVDNADVFGIKLDAAPVDAPPVALIPEGQSRLDAISTPSQMDGGEAAVLHQIQNATPDELLAMISQAGGGAVR